MQHKIKKWGNRTIRQSSLVLLIGVLVITSFFYATTSGFLYSISEAQTLNLDSEIDDLEGEIEEKRGAIAAIDDKIKQYRAEIQAKQAEAKTLQAQLSILEQQLETTGLEIQKLEIRVNQTELEIIANEKQVQELNQQKEIMKQQIAELIREIYKEDDKSYLEIVLLNDNISEFFNHISYLSGVEEHLQTDLDQLERVVTQLAVEQRNLETRKNNLVAVKKKLEEERGRIESQQVAQEVLLSQTKNSERQYQNLIAKERALQDSINSDIQGLETRLREKLRDAKQLGDISKQGMIWPVPSRYVTAGFHDSDYPFRHIFEHPAIDIRAKQGTPIRAAASGYVARAKDAGMGYSYIMLIHANGVSTVYGHVSQINVEEDTYVVQGDVIGLSGGMPGTPGAGNLTTGPHLHFETRYNGIPVNPIGYLP